MTVIRPAIIDDAEEIAQVHVQGWQETYRGLMPDEVLDTLSIERRTTQWRRALEDPQDMYHNLVVADVNGKVVGFSNFGAEREGNTQYAGEIAAIYVLKEFHGQGIGRALIQKSVEGLLARNISSMLVWVLKENPARKFYEHLGGVYLREKTVEMGNSMLNEAAYGWLDIRPLAGKGLR